ncbi:hypothetical protein BGZ82_005333 [Podila clonocystis]|nr:hypothetical protein BGZ82_005333 [Podila clonocystis]
MISSRSSIKAFKHSIPSPRQEPLPVIPVDQTAKATISQTTKVPIDQTARLLSIRQQSRLAFTPEEIERLSKPKVLISGAGIGGLTLAILLQKGGAFCTKVSGKDDKVLTIGDYIERTPQGRDFKSHAGREGMNPCGAAGAVTAMHDAAALANWISTLRFPSMTDLDQVFKEYRAERYPVA